MTLEAGKEMDKRCVLNWLNEVYVTPSKAFNEYTEDELKMFAHDALALLKELPDITRCKYCKYSEECIPPCEDRYCVMYDQRHDGDWFCADGRRRENK